MDKADILFSTTLINLLQGVVQKEDNAEIWNTIRSQQFRIDEYRKSACRWSLMMKEALPS